MNLIYKQETYENKIEKIKGWIYDTEMYYLIIAYADIANKSEQFEYRYFR